MNETIVEYPDYDTKASGVGSGEYPIVGASVTVNYDDYGRPIVHTVGIYSMDRKVIEDVAKTAINTALLEHLNRFHSTNIIDMSRVVSDDEAEIEIRELLEHLKDEGEGRVGLIRLIIETNLPGEQIERIMDRLTDEGVKSVEE